jgi:hypothetical protein
MARLKTNPTFIAFSIWLIDISGHPETVDRCGYQLFPDLFVLYHIIVIPQVFTITFLYSMRSSVAQVFRVW